MTTTSEDAIPVDALGQVMLLESFIDQAARHALAKLNLRVRLGRLQERRHEAATSSKENIAAEPNKHDASMLANTLVADAARFHHELAALDSRTQSTFSIVDKLRARTGTNEPSDGLRIRSRIYELLCICFSDIFPATIVKESAMAQSRGLSDAYSNMRRASLAAYDSALDGPENHAMWSLVRPCKTPCAVAQLFLSLSAQVAQLQRNHYNPLLTLSVGDIWYSLLSDLFAQLALSAVAFGEFTPRQVLDALDLVSPDSEDREVLYPALWKTPDEQLVAAFDADWKHIRRAVSSLDSAQTAKAAEASLVERSSPHSFCNKLSKYFEAVLDHLDPPMLDVYNKIRQTGKFPQGFFDTPDDSIDLPAHPQLISDSAENATIGDMSLLDPFSPRAPFSAPQPSNFAPADMHSDDASQSPSERVAQAHAYNALSMSAKRASVPLVMRTSDGSTPASPTEDILMQRVRSAVRDGRAPVSLARQPSLADGADDDDDDDDGEETDDVEMSPSRHASIKRQKSNDLIMTPVQDSAQRKTRNDGSTSMIGDEDMDIENTVAAESPSALLSAKHDKRIRDSVRHTQALPPKLDFTPKQRSSETVATLDADMDERTSLHGPSQTSSAMTTPKSQTGSQARVEKSRYVSDWDKGDVEGGGRPHRRRHDPHALGTPNSSRPGALPPPPQTLLSPKNIAAAQRKNVRLETLIAESESDMAPISTPERSKASEDPLSQVTPEHQIGSAADARAKSATRYVIHKEQGDVEGGGRKHRKRQRSSHELLNIDI
ncbi:hypothetical protein GGI12_001338 [Dipsacomyces acuminosporus]|nr:hypothetical protein GGI12_001338 [Dipsacomyces acuminosporus]